MVTVISDKNKEIAARIMQEFARLTTIIRMYDEDAFIITSETKEVRGEGLKAVSE